MKTTSRSPHLLLLSSSAPPSLLAYILLRPICFSSPHVLVLSHPLLLLGITGTRLKTLLFRFSASFKWRKAEVSQARSPVETLHSPPGWSKGVEFRVFLSSSSPPNPHPASSHLLLLSSYSASFSSSAPPPLLISARGKATASLLVSLLPGHMYPPLGW